MLVINNLQLSTGLLEFWQHGLIIDSRKKIGRDSFLSLNSSMT